MTFSKRRHNQGTGISTNTTTVYGLNAIMQKMIAKLPAELPKKDKPSKPKANVILTDDQVIECRTRYEFEGWSTKRLLEEYSKFGVHKQYLRKLLDYTTRSKLIPKKK